MATAPPPPPTPWHTLLQARLEAAERAMKELRAVCEQPEARAALEVRACGCACTVQARLACLHTRAVLTRRAVGV